MNKLLYFLIGRKIVINCTPVKFTRKAIKAIRNAGWFIGSTVYMRRDTENPDTFIGYDQNELIVFHINLKGEYSHAL